MDLTIETRYEFSIWRDTHVDRLLLTRAEALSLRDAIDEAFTSDLADGRNPHS